MGWEGISSVVPLAGAAVAVLGAIGGAITWWVRRADRREDQMIELWKQRAIDAEEHADDEQAEREMWERRATRWHQQLMDHGIKPDPKWGDPV
jgi:hypothetical protein